MFGAKCWAKIPTTLGGSKLNPQSTECHLLGYASGSGNYKVQDITSCQVFISHDVVFEEGRPCCTSTSVREHQVPLFDMNIIPPANIHVPPINDLLTLENSTTDLRLDQTNNSTTNHQTNIPIKPCQSTRALQPSKASIQSTEYQRHETAGRGKGLEWAMDEGNPKGSVTVTIDCPEG